ncbi:MAG: hypothetical protein LBF34_02340 [Puniceicoccales bacterium]|jgi:hypothetical protein|nr:hypothetical protein [Puniceicoccales bacterium]
MALRLIGNLLIDVNQRGSRDELPLQAVWRTALFPQLFDPICRRALADYDVAVKMLMGGILRLLVLSLSGRNGGLLLDQIESIVSEIFSLGFHNLEVFTPEARGRIDRVLLDYSRGTVICQNIPQNTYEIFWDLAVLWKDPRVNVNDYVTCLLAQLNDAIDRKISFLIRRMQLDPSNFSGDLIMQLCSLIVRLITINANRQLIYNYYTNGEMRWLE